jgi:hypothetical protein
MSGWLDLSQLGLAPNQKHQALLGAPKIVQCGEHYPETIETRPLPGWPLLLPLSSGVDLISPRFLQVAMCAISK